MIRAGNPSDSKTGSVDIYYKEFFAVRPFEVENLNEWI